MPDILPVEMGIPMRAVIQRAKSASVTVENKVVGQIGRGLVVLVGKEEADTQEDIDWLAAKLVGLRLFGDDSGPWAKNVIEIGGDILLVSQFTLHGSTKKGTKPSWHRAAKPDDLSLTFEFRIPICSDRFCP